MMDHDVDHDVARTLCKEIIGKTIEAYRILNESGGIRSVLKIRFTDGTILRVASWEDDHQHGLEILFDENKWVTR